MPVDMKRPAKISTESETDVERIEIATAANGFEVTCYHKDKPSTKKNEIGPYTPPKRYVFTDADSMMAFVKKKLAGMDIEDYGPGEDVPGDEAE